MSGLDWEKANRRSKRAPRDRYVDADRSDVKHERLAARNYPPTAKQIRYLRMLREQAGVTDDEISPRSRGEISLMIDEYKQRRASAVST